MKFFLPAVLLFASLTALPTHADIYQSTDSAGNTSYSDISTNPQAKKITPQPANIVPAQIPSSQYLPSKKQQATRQTHTIQITSPLDDSVIRDNQGNMIISASIQPPLSSESKIQIHIYFDEKLISQGKVRSTSINNADRGTHTIRAALVSPAGKILARSNTVAVHVKKHSKNPVHHSLRY